MGTYKSTYTGAQVDAAVQKTQDIGSIANGKGASMVGVEDSEGLFTAAQVEAILAEIAGAGRRTETLKGLGDSISTHLAEIAAHAELSNKTITVGSGKDFATISAAVNSIKKRLFATITINVDAGTYPESLNIVGFEGSGMLALNGDTVVSDSRVVNVINVSGNTCHISITGFKCVSTSGHAFNCVRNASVNIIYCKAIESAPSVSGALFDRTNGSLANSLISNHSHGLRTMNSSVVFSNENSGAGNIIGLEAINASTIGKYSTQPGGTTAESMGGGGVIR